MRTISAAKQAVIDGGLKGYRLKVEIKDFTSAWRDMSSYPGFDSVLNANWQETLDNGVTSATVSFMRELDGLSLAPLVSSGPNTGFNPAASNNPLIAVNAEIRISVAAFAGDNTPASGDYDLVFQGRIDSFDVADYAVTVQCRDTAGQLTDTFIEKERVYAGAAVSGVPVGVRIFEPGDAYEIGDYVMPTEANRNISGSPRFFEVIFPGNAGTSEPVWSLSGPTISGSVEFGYVGVLTPTTGYPVQSVMQAILNENGLSGITLYTPISPSWNILIYKQDRTSVFDALRTLATQIGWDLRMKWDNGTSAFRLTFYDPNRAKTTPDYTFDSDDYEQLSEVSLDKQDIRNVIQVIYSDRSTLAPLGQSRRKVLQVADFTSIAKYGRLFMEIQEEESSNIDSASEATALANAALSDLKEPTISHTVDLAFGFYWAQLNDLYRFKANGRHYSSDQDLACVGISHELSDGIMRTSLQCRGKPTAGVAVWSNAAVRPLGSTQIHSTSILGTENGITIDHVPVHGGARFNFSSLSVLKDIPIEYELHVSQTSGFTPSVSTLVQYGATSQVEVLKLNPGATYYAKLIPWYRNATRIVRGEPSADYTFVAGRAVTGHLPSDVQYWRQPINGNLDNAFDRDARKDELPDHWNLKAGTLGTQVASKYDATAGVGNAVSGRYYIRFNTSSSTGAIESDPMIIEGGKRYRLTALAKNISGTGSWSAKVNFLKFDKTANSTETYSQSVTADVGSWVDRVWYVNAPAAARYATIEVTTATTSTQSFDLDSVRFDEAVEIARYYHYPTFGIGASIPDATNTLINFNTAFDSQTNANITTGAAWKYTAPRTGYYLIQTAVTIVFGNNDTGTCYIEVWKNGAAHRRMTRQSGHVLREETQYMASCVLYLSKGDYIHINIYQATGGAKSLEAGTQTYVEIMQID